MKSSHSTFVPSSLSTTESAPCGLSPFAKKTFALVPSLLVAGSMGAQTADSTRTPSAEPAADAVELPAVTVEAASQPKASSPKFTAPLIDTPQTVVVIPREVFEQQGATTLRDVLRNTPGITFAAGEGGTANGDQMTIRGFDARTDIFVDGIRDAGTYTRDAFNLEQVEVIKGPSSSVTGRGSTGASVNLVSKTPRLDTFRAGTVGIGTDDYYRATLDVNQPLTASPIAGTAVRLNALWQDSGVPGRDEVENKTWAVAPSFALGLGTATRATVSFQHMEQDNIPDYGIPWVPTTFTNPSVGTPGGQPNVDQSNWYGLLDRDYEKVTSDVATLNLEHDIGADTTLRNTTRYGRTDRDSVITAPRFVNTTGVPTTDIRRNDWKSRDQVDDILADNVNLTTAFDTGFIRHDLSTGLEVSRERSKNYGRDYAPGTVFPSTDVFDPNPNDPFTGVLTRNGAVTSSNADTFSLYAFDTLKLSERWQLNGGLRWDRFSVDYYNRTAANVVTALARTDEMLSWKTGLVFKPRPNGTIYLGYGTSFNPSAEGLSLGTSTALLEPEESTNIEIGTKWEFFRNRLALNAALFRTDKSNARSTDPLTSVVSLAGDQRVQGFELGASGMITENWGIFAGYAYMESEVLDSANATEIGSALARVPQNSFNLWTTYRLPFGLTLGAGTQYMDEVDRSTTTLNQVAPSYWLYNAMASYEVNKNLTLRLNVNNLTDEQYVDRVGGGHYIPGPSRSFILTAIFAF
ncbi:MAG: TonB-dependent siderophore receptor [Opitutaceae bacterium]|jgi:catecholate siderophore receptor